MSTKSFSLSYLPSPLLSHPQVVLIKNGMRACGSGGALATAPLIQSKSYFEVKLQQSGHWGIGVATPKSDLNQPRGGLDKDSWCLTSDNCVSNDGKVLHELKGAENQQLKTDEERRDSLTDVLLPEIKTSDDVRLSPLGIPAEGDTIGVSFDHVELNFYLNGKNLEVPVLNVRGSVFPALYGRELQMVCGHSSVIKYFFLSFSGRWSDSGYRSGQFQVRTTARIRSNHVGTVATVNGRSDQFIYKYIIP